MSASGGGPVGGREEKGGADGSQRHPPHVTEGVDDGPVQRSTPTPRDVPVEAANAHGQDTVSTDEEARRSIRSTSAYDDRPEEDKDVELDAGA